MSNILGLAGWQPSEPQESRAADPASPKPIPTGTKGRISADDSNFSKSVLGVLAPLAPSKTWRDYNLDSGTFDRMPVDKIIELMTDVSPEISRGLWDFIRMVNPGWSLRVFKPGATVPEDQPGGERDEDDKAKQYLEDYFRLLKDLYGSVDVVINKIIIGGFLRGGFLGEVVLGAKGKETIDFVTPDPNTLQWRQIDGGLRGSVWEFGQYQAGQFVALSIYPTIKYVPIDPLPGKPYGRSIVHPALFPTLFLIALLRDLKRVVAQQGYPRLDLEISVEKIISTLGDAVDEDPEKLQQLVSDSVSKAIDEVKRIYANLEPDQAYIHTDTVKVNRPVGTIDSSSLGSLDKIVSMLERMMVRALKTMPLLMAVTGDTSEANANRQWEIHAAAIKSIQHLIEGLIESLLSVALRANGLQGEIEFRFSELRAAEMMRDAQTEKLRIENAKSKYNAGWISQDQASEEVTGHKAIEKEPRNSMIGIAAGSGANDPMNVQPEPGSNRMRRLDAARTLASAAVLLALNEGAPTLAEERHAKDWWIRNAPDDEAAGVIDAEVEE